jgi:hypothetical protein
VPPTPTPEGYCENNANCVSEKACVNNSCQTPSCPRSPGECEEYLYTFHLCSFKAKADGTACGVAGKCQSGTCIEPLYPGINFKIKYDAVTKQIGNQKVKVKVLD